MHKHPMFQGPNWVVNAEGNVYEEGDEGGVSFKGHFGHNAIVSMDGKCLFTIGEPLAEDF